MAVSINPPLLTPMPPAPLPTDAEAVFDAKAGASLTAQGNLVGEQNLALAWQAGAMAETKAAQEAAALSATAAADSAILAGQQVGLAADQVALAVNAKNLSQVAATNAAASAAAAESSSGSIGNLALLHAVALSF